MSGTTFTNEGRIASHTFGPATDPLRVVRGYTLPSNWQTGDDVGHSNGVVLQRDESVQPSFFEGPGSVRNFV